MQSKPTTISSVKSVQAPDLSIAQQELASIAYEASRVAVSLSSISRVISDEDNPIDSRHIGGLCEAVELIGEGFERFITDRQALVEHIEQERMGGHIRKPC